MSGFSSDASKEAKLLESELLMMVKFRLPDGFVLTENCFVAQILITVMALCAGDSKKKVTKRVLTGDLNNESSTKNYYGSARFFVPGFDKGLFDKDIFSEATLIEGRQPAAELNVSSMANSIGSIFAQAIGQAQTAKSANSALF